MPPVSLLIKPASSSCNLRCKYCFYHSMAKKRMIESYGMMSLDTLEILVKKALDYAEYSCTFAFQGGEPSLAGLEYYRSLVGFVKKYNHKKLEVHYAIQTNGLAINEEWARFIKENKFLAGISLDGPKDIHDLMRVDAQGKGSFTKVMKTIALFNRINVEYNVLCVVNNDVARHIRQIYAFFKKNGFRFLQFIPCLDPLGEKQGGYEHSLTTERYTAFLKSLFDFWHEDIINSRKISIRYFDNLVGMAMGYPPESCGMDGVCKVQYVVEAHGGVYPCDFYAVDQWYMGNIIDQDFESLRNSDAAKSFEEVSRHVDPKCTSCRWYGLCRGGCRRYREPFAASKPDLNIYCEAYNEFFVYARERIMHLARFLTIK